MGHQTTTAPRSLLITCDDLGYHPTVNEAIVEILAGGIVRSVSIMPAAPHFDDAVRRLAAAGIDRVGVHLVLAGEYPRLPLRPVSDPRDVPSLVDGDGRFSRDLVAGRDRFVPHEVAQEFASQIEKVRAAGLRVDHLDGHMFCYEASVGGPRLLAAAHAVADRYALPLRCRARSRAGTLPRTHMFWAPAPAEAAAQRYAEFLRSYDLPLAELIIHPGKDREQMATFSKTGEWRHADYLFFRSAAFAELVRARQLRVIGWDEL